MAGLKILILLVGISLFFSLSRSQTPRFRSSCTKQMLKGKVDSNRRGGDVAAARTQESDFCALEVSTYAAMRSDDSRTNNPSPRMAAAHAI